MADVSAVTVTMSVHATREELEASLLCMCFPQAARSMQSDAHARSKATKHISDLVNDRPEHSPHSDMTELVHVPTRSASALQDPLHSFAALGSHA